MTTISRPKTALMPREQAAAPRARGYVPAKVTPEERAASIGGIMATCALIAFLVMLGALYIHSVGLFLMPTL